MTWILLLLVSLASAGPALDAVSAGDRAWYTGDRVGARDLWRVAAEGEEPEAEAMARLRLLRISGNWGLLLQGARIESAMAEARGAWGWMAAADYHRLLPPGVGGDPAEAERICRRMLTILPGPAAARLYLLTGDPEWLEHLAQAEDRDGLGEAILENEGQLPAHPGTWSLGLGVSGAPGAGVGVGLSFAHPDTALRGWQSSLTLSGLRMAPTDGEDPRWSLVAALGLRSPGQVYGSGQVLAMRSFAFIWDEATGAQSGLLPWNTLQLSVGPGVSLGRWRLALLGSLRWDEWEAIEGKAGLQRGHGPRLSAWWDGASGWGKTRKGFAFGGSVSAAWLDYGHLGARLDGRVYQPFAKGVVAARVTGAVELAEDAPVLRLPSLGGADLHRGAPAGRYRAPAVATVDLEQRWMLVGPLEMALFVNGAAVGGEGEARGLHWGAGGGIRLIFPPEELNVVRLDVATSDAVLAVGVPFVVVVGLGEAF